MATTYLTRTPASAGNRKTWTISLWVKRSGLGSNSTYFFSQGASTGDNFAMLFNSTDQLYIWDYHGAWDFEFKTNAKYRDTSGWYNIVVACDTTQAVEANRFKVYVNGDQITSWATESYPSINDDTRVNDTTEVRWGRYVASEASYFNGLMSHIHFSDGYALAPTVFGSTDATTGEWEINVSPSFTLGTNGFTILKDGNTITDQSINSNAFTLGGGTLTNTEDCPADVFCTLNPLAPITTGSLSYGNTRIVGTVSTNYGYNTVGSLGDSKGKYYCEIKYTVANANTNCTVGVVNLNNHESNVNTTSATGGYVAFRFDGTKFINGSSTAGYWATPTAGDIMMIALDMDNLKVWVGLNGSWYGTTGNTDGNPATGANPSATITAGVFSPVNIRHLAGTFDCNFGNGYFGTTIISSAGTNASNIGIFEHDVPTGYTAISTKGLNS